MTSSACVRAWAAAIVAAAAPAVASAEAGATLSIDEPRAYGYQVGDVFERRLVVDAARTQRLDEASLPAAGRRGHAIELRAVQHERIDAGERTRHVFVLRYQVFHAPVEVTTLEVAPFTLRLYGAPRDETLRVEALPVTVAPLVPVAVSPREGLGEWRPDAPVPAVDATASRQRLVAYAVLALPLLGYLAHVYVGLPWLAARRRPFGRAWRAVRGGGDPLAALRAVHGAINATAGRVVLEGDLARFVAEHPRFAALRDDFARFFAQSRQAHFAGGAAAVDAAFVAGLCRRCRDLERGSA